MFSTCGRSGLQTLVLRMFIWWLSWVSVIVRPAARADPLILFPFDLTVMTWVMLGTVRGLVRGAGRWLTPSVGGVFVLSRVVIGGVPLVGVAAMTRICVIFGSVCSCVLVLVCVGLSVCVQAVLGVLSIKWMLLGLTRRVWIRLVLITD